VFFKKLFLFFCRLLWRLVLLAFLFALAVALWLAVAQTPVPDSVLRAALARWDALGTPFLAELSRADISFKRLNVHDFKIIQKGVLDGPVLSVKRVSLDLTPTWSRDPRAWVSRITFNRLDLPALPDVLHGETQVPFPDFKIPATVQPLEIEIHESRIFGVPFFHLYTRLEAAENTLRFDPLQFMLQRPHSPRHFPEGGLGPLRCDFENRVLSCALDASASTGHVNSFIESWGIPLTQRIIQRIHLEPPYPNASFRIEYAFGETYALDLSLAFEDARGAYLGVPLQLATGRVRYAETNEYHKLELHNFIGSSPSGPLRLNLTLLEETVDVEASGTLPVAEINLLAGHPFTDEEIEIFTPLGPVSATVSGRIDIHTNNLWRATDFRGVFYAEKSSFLDLPLSTLTGSFNFAGPRIMVEPFTFDTPGSGRINGSLSFGLQSHPGTLSGRLNVDAIPLSELHFFLEPTATNSAVSGSVGGSLDFASSLEKPAHILEAEGSCAITDARLVRIPLFAWFTDFMASNIPGIDWLTQQTDATCAFTIADGTFNVTRLAITGGAFTIRGRGSYDIPGDDLDLAFQAHFFGDRNIFQYLTFPITGTINSLLLTFRVTGPLENPVWQNSAILPRLLRGVGDTIWSIFDDE